MRIPAWARTERVAGNDKRKESDGIPKLLAPLFITNTAAALAGCPRGREREREQAGNRASCT